MKLLVSIFICTILFFGLFNVVIADVTHLFVNNKYGYQFIYPIGWELSSEPWDEQHNTDVPTAEATLVIVSYNNEICVKKEDCVLYLQGYGDGTRKKYLEALKNVQDIKSELGLPVLKSRVEETLVNGNRTEIVLKESSKFDFKLYTFVFCEESKRIFSISVDKKYEVSFSTIFSGNKEITIRNMYGSDQAKIIESFRCPVKNFKSGKAIPKKK